MLSDENVATPAAAAALAVPARLASGEPLPGVMASVTNPTKPVAVFPMLSCAVTTMAGAIGCPATAEVGWTLTTRELAAPGATLKVELVMPVNPGALAASVYSEPTLSRLSVANVATPATAATVVVPDSVAPAAPDPAV